MVTCLRCGASGRTVKPLPRDSWLFAVGAIPAPPNWSGLPGAVFGGSVSAHMGQCSVVCLVGFHHAGIGYAFSKLLARRHTPNPRQSTGSRHQSSQGSCAIIRHFASSVPLAAIPASQLVIGDVVVSRI